MAGSVNSQQIQHMVDFFPKLKEYLKGLKFTDDEEDKCRANRFL